jgi:hypothetical protein
MARFIECRTSQGIVYQVNVDQITYLQRGAKDEIGARNFLSAALSIRTTRCFAVNRRVVPRGDHSLEVKAARFGSNRHAARRRFEQRFSSVLIAKDYVALYCSLLKNPSISERETPCRRHDRFWQKR